MRVWGRRAGREDAGSRQDGRGATERRAEPGAALPRAVNIEEGDFRMSDMPSVLHMGEGSPEQIAYKLMLDVMKVENRVIANSATAGPHTPADRHYLLNTYHECLMAVRGKRVVASSR